MTATSYSLAIRDGILARVRVMPFFAAFNKFSKSNNFQVMPAHIPYAGVYFLDEVLTPDGDANAGEPRFFHTMRVGFSIIVQNNDPEAAEDKLDEAFWAIMNGLMCDPTLYNNDLFRIESYPRASRSHHFGAVDLENELPVAELRAELICTYRSNFPPLVEDPLITIHVETGFPLGGTVAERDATQQVTAQYDLPQHYGPVAVDLETAPPVLGTPSVS